MFAMTVRMFKVIALILEGVKQFVFDFPTRATRSRYLVGILDRNRQARHPGMDCLLALLVFIIVANNVGLLPSLAPRIKSILCRSSSLM